MEKKIYVIGAGHIDIEKIRLAVNIPESTEIILVNSKEDIPFEERMKSDLSVREITPIKLIPRDNLITVFPVKRKGHERPYKFHR